MKIKDLRRRRRVRRKRGIRKKIYGTSDRPRLTVFRSLKNICAQIIDDEKGLTLVAASTLGKDLRDQIRYGGNIEAAAIVGKALAEKARARNIDHVRFDRNGYRYHGRVRGLAEAAREAGLRF
ncbi:MAG: 50S ribosomal protein L18 [Phycisphaerales bacterium]|nr:MAG: 50S ribosomal protein L18 [Phycisphaerales bacterium]